MNFLTEQFMYIAETIIAIGAVGGILFKWSGKLWGKIGDKYILQKTKTLDAFVGQVQKPLFDADKDIKQIVKKQSSALDFLTYSHYRTKILDYVKTGNQEKALKVWDKYKKLGGNSYIEMKLKDNGWIK
jgi:hypothetical protein